MLLADLDAPRKQRHTVVRICRRLINEHAMDDVSYQVVRAYVAKRKPEIRVEAGRGPAQVFIEQSHLADAEAEVDEWDLADEARRIGTRPRTIGELFAVERPSLKPLPVETFETGRWFTPRVDRFSQITVRTNRYSVPTRFIGRQDRVLLHASELVVFHGRTEIAQHERLLTKSGSRLELDHCLEALLRKPGALPGATVLEQARAAGKFTPIHEGRSAAALRGRENWPRCA